MESIEEWKLQFDMYFDAYQNAYMITRCLHTAHVQLDKEYDKLKDIYNSIPENERSKYIMPDKDTINIICEKILNKEI